MYIDKMYTLTSEWARFDLSFNATITSLQII